MHEYNFTLGAEASILKDIIMLNDTLRPLVSNISVSTNMDGSVDDDNVSIETTAVLLSAEEDELNTAINGYSANPLVVRYQIEHNTMNPAMTYGMNFLAKFSANNLYLGKTALQINTLLDTYPELIHAAITGSLVALYQTMCTMVADANISQEEIDEFKKRLEIYLGII